MPCGGRNFKIIFRGMLRLDEAAWVGLRWRQPQVHIAGAVATVDIMEDNVNILVIKGQPVVIFGDKKGNQ
jgi:hypothetical protein